MVQMAIGPLAWAWGDLSDYPENPGSDLEWYLLLRLRKGVVFARVNVHYTFHTGTLPLPKSARCQALACTTYGVLAPPTTPKISVFVQASWLHHMYP